MTRDAALSPTMDQALRVALTRDGLERWPGGWWTYPGCEAHHEQPSAWRGTTLLVPAWSVGIGTIISLVKRGYMTFTDRDPRTRLEIKAVPTDKARSLT